MACNPTLIFWGLIALSMAGYLFFTYAYGLSSSLDWYHTVNITFQSQQFWLAALLVPLLLALSDSIVHGVLSVVDPTSQDKLLELYERDRKRLLGQVDSESAAKKAAERGSGGGVAMVESFV